MRKCKLEECKNSVVDSNDYCSNGCFVEDTAKLRKEQKEKEIMQQKPEPELKLNTPLKSDEIEFRAGSINKGGYITLMAYKTARTDIQRLNDVIGVGFWKRTHREFRGNIYCVLEIYNKEISEWVSVEDVGHCKASTWDKSIQIKGEASDSFKRACVNLGIGIELYSYPEISVKLNQNEFYVEGDKKKVSWEFKIKEWKCKTKFDDDDNIIFFALQDAQQKRRFTWDKAVHGG